MKNLICEAVGSFVVFLVGCGCVVVYGSSDAFVGSLAFGLALAISYLVLKRFTNAHIITLISFYKLLEKEIDVKKFLLYTIFQILGSLLAALVLLFIASQCQDLSFSSLFAIVSGYSQNASYALTIGGLFILELVLSFLFVMSYIYISKNKNIDKLYPFVMGIIFMFITMLSLATIGGAANPAKSIAAAFIFGPISGNFGLMLQVWIFVAASLIGTMSAVWVYRVFNKNQNLSK